MAPIDSLKAKVIGTPQGDSSEFANLQKTKADSLSNVSVHTAAKKKQTVSDAEYFGSPVKKAVEGYKKNGSFMDALNAFYKPDTKMNKKADSAAFSY